jgi:ankyrin repeat protein
VQLLFEKWITMARNTNSESTALYEVAMAGRENVVRSLLKSRVDAMIEDGSGWAAQYIASMSGHKAVVQLLLEKGMDIAVR